MPGAFAYHLHSFSAAALRTTNQNWTGALLARGATVSMGTVHEPYLAGTPDIGVFTARFMVQEFSFGEAAYASQNVLSWQTTVVGDPLYRPLKKHPQRLLVELEVKKSKLVEWPYLRLVHLNLRRNMPISQMVTYLEDLSNTRESAVLSEKLGDLCLAEGKPSSAIHSYQQALKLDPSRQQRIRLRLTLGERLTAASREEEAFVNYQKLLEETPAYPDKITILRKLSALAQKLGKSTDVEKYTAEIKRLTEPAPKKDSSG
jgi:tetratricopeptide (TPR) repeat protein